MLSKFLRIFHVICFGFLGLTFLVQPAYSKTYKIYDIDIIDITGVDYANDILRVRFRYLDRDKGTYVYWEKKSVDCSCQVYPLTNDQKKNKGLLASNRKFLEEYNQLFFIDIPRSHVKDFEYGHIECQFNIGWKVVETEDDFRFR